MPKKQIKVTVKDRGKDFYKEALITMITEFAHAEAMHDYDYLTDHGYCVSSGYHHTTKHQTQECDNCDTCKIEYAKGVYKEIIKKNCERFGLNYDDIEWDNLFTYYPG